MTVQGSGGQGCLERRDEVLVVHDGAARLRWRHGPDGFALAGVGPSIEELALVGAQVGHRLPLLVVLEPATLPVAVLEQELVETPRGVRVLAAEDGILDVDVDLLDWLPAPLRVRGRRFLAEADRTEATTPAHLLPAVLVDVATEHERHVRFARRSAVCPSWTPALLDSLLVDLFGPVPAPPAADLVPR